MVGPTSPNTSVRATWEPVMHPNTNDPPKLVYWISEAVTPTSLSNTTLYAKIAANELRAVRVGGRTVIPAESLHALIHGEG